MEVKPGYKQTEVGVIPEEWDVKTLGEAVDFLDGRRRPVKDSDRAKLRGDIPYYGASGIVDYVNDYLFDEDLILLGEDGENILSRNCRLAFKISGKNWVNNHAHVLRPKPNFVLDYLVEFLESRDYAQYNTGTAQPKLNKLVCSGIPVVQPPMAEQRAIATALSDVDRLLAGLDRLIAKKRDLKQATMQQLLTGQTRLPGFHGEWEVKRLGDVISHCFSGATPRRNRPEFYKGNVRWITSGELNYNVITDTLEKISSEAVAETNLTIHPVGTFLMAITGLEAEGTRGACGIVGAPSTTNQSCMAVFPTAALAREFLFHYYVFRGKSLALQYCQGTKQQSYTASLVKQLPIELPPTVPEQAAIAEVLSDMDAELAVLEQRREKTRALKQAIMQELLTGRTRLVATQVAP